MKKNRLRSLFLPLALCMVFPLATSCGTTAAPHENEVEISGGNAAQTDDITEPVPE
jgi:hypothetical protein